MGNWLPSFVANPSDEDLEYYENEEKIQKQKHKSIDDLVDAGDTLQLLGFLAKQGQDVTEVKRLIGEVLQKYDNRCHEIYSALQDKICLHEDFKKTRETYEELIKKGVIATRDIRARNQTGDSKTFKVNMDGLLKTFSAAGAGAMGTIVVMLLEGIRDVKFFEKSCETKGYLDRQIGITDITWTDITTKYDGIIAFEVAKISLKMLTEKGELAFIGGEKIKVEVDAFYARSTIRLKEVIPDEDKRREVVQEILNKPDTKTGYKIQG